jgi:hypothetical protein
MMNRRPRRNFIPAYHRKYGGTRSIRAERMASNRAPEGMQPPPTGGTTIRALNTRALFTNTSRYVESLFDNTGELRLNLFDRQFIVVRSQKFADDNKRHYFVGLPFNVSLQNVDFSHVREFLRSCTCNDYRRGTVWCKHKLAVQFKLQGHNILLRY